MDYLELDITKKQPLTNRIYLRQGDGGIQKIGIQILKDGQPYSVTGYSLKFEGNLSDGKMVQGNATSEDANQGKFIYTFRNADSSVAGDMRNAYFRLYDTTGNALASRRILVTVEKNADVTAGQAKKYVSDVDEVISEAQEKLEMLENSLVDVNLHQAWATGENGEGFTTVYPGENIWLGERKYYWESATAGWSEYTGIRPTDNGTKFNDATFVTASFFLKVTEKLSTDVRVQVVFSKNGYNRQVYNIYVPRAQAISGEMIKKTIDITKYNTEINQVIIALLKPAEIAGEEFSINDIKIELGENLDPIYTSPPQDDPINCHPKYVGFGIKNSDNYQDYKWILNPEWAMANALYGTEMTTLKQQLNRSQDLTEGK